jgi:hypothetical protein
MAADISAQLASGLLSKLYEQIDPLRLAEYDRTNRIAEQYGNRIQSKNVKAGTINKLLEEYPSHEFCIDPEEAKDLFHNVETPTDDLEALGNLLKPLADKFLENDETGMFYLTDPPSVTNPKKSESNENQAKEHISQPNGGGEVARDGNTGEKHQPKIAHAREKDAG